MSKALEDIAIKNKTGECHECDTGQGNMQGMMGNAVKY